MKRIFACSAIVAALGVVSAANAQTIYGLTTRNQLVSWQANTPGTLNQAVFMSGMAANEAIVGIDFRPSNGQMYALGSYARLYTVNTTTGGLSFVANLTDSISGSALALQGVEFGVDFNPAADRLRVTSNLGQNLRINVATGVTIQDGPLNQAVGTPHIVGSAYLNNDNNPSTGTTLYNLDSSSDMLTIQNPPNNGTQTMVGALGVDITALAGFDILTQGTNNTAYAALQPAGTTGSSFYTVNLASGAVSLVGVIGQNQSSDSLAIRDIAAVPEPATMIALGMGAVALLRRRKKA